MKNGETVPKAKKTSSSQERGKQSTMMMTQGISNKKQKLSIGQLPTPIILDILSRLPIKTLFDCKLVCKDWLSLTSDRYFAKLHLLRSKVSLLLKAFTSNQLRLVDLDLQTLQNSHPLDAQLKFNPNVNFPLGNKIGNSCNGLLCLYDQSDPVYVCNPILGEFIRIPRSQYNGRYHVSISAFGFSPQTNQYKVIQFFLQRVPSNRDFEDMDYFNFIAGLEPYSEDHTYREEAEAQIYTIGEGPWRNLGRAPFHLSKCSFNAFLNGALHWLSFNGNSLDFIRCFDFGNEQFRVVSGPPNFGLHKKKVPNCTSLGVLRDNLSICDFSSTLRIDIWIMKDYNVKESWCKELVLKRAIVKIKPLKHCEPIMILKGGEILMLVNKNALVQYNPKLHSFKELDIYGVELDIYGVKSKFYATAHTPTFVSLKDVAKGESLTRMMNC